MSVSGYVHPFPLLFRVRKTSVAQGPRTARPRNDAYQSANQAFAVRVVPWQHAVVRLDNFVISYGLN
jgi:hypothetical protein